MYLVFPKFSKNYLCYWLFVGQCYTRLVFSCPLKIKSILFTMKNEIVCGPDLSLSLTLQHITLPFASATLFFIFPQRQQGVGPLNTFLISFLSTGSFPPTSVLISLFRELFPSLSFLKSNPTDTCISAHL